MMLGNHCTYYKNTNKINSPELLLDNTQTLTSILNQKKLLLVEKVF